MRNKLKVLGIVAAVVIIGLSLTACGGGNLQGEWVELDSGVVFALRSDGSFVTDFASGTFSVSGNRLTLRFTNGPTRSGTFRRVDNFLDIDWDNGMRGRWQRWQGW